MKSLKFKKSFGNKLLTKYSIVYFVLFLCVIAPVFKNSIAQTFVPNDSLWVTNGQVNTIAD